MPSLTADVGLRVGPVVLETLIKHYFNYFKTGDDDSMPRLRQETLMYDEVFSVLKAFMHASSFHTVEEVQAFGNTRTPSPPWTHVVRLVLPMECCDEAAGYLIQALGGEESTKKIVGGTKWWQVRGVQGIDAQWITAKKNWKEAKRLRDLQRKEKENKGEASSPANWDEVNFEPDSYEKYMDEMRCILYCHGGGYFFGSVDQERYSIERHARKINGRVFAVNYRLAPQYPFPCALQDVLAAYLFLIRPPPGMAHRPVNPAHIVVAGDSAGGGLSLALLQLIRDSGLPMPAGGVLISPWCDLTHSFPSIHTNTATDVIPSWGLSLQKPSMLWPPAKPGSPRPTHRSLRARIHKAFSKETDVSAPIDVMLHRKASPDSPIPVDLGKSISPPNVDGSHDQVISLLTESGETLTIKQQVHMYTENNLIAHPLVSPILSYLGGLPPLLFIASDREVLRDEIIYTAHKAAAPHQYPITDKARRLYPSLNDIDQRYGPTKVHLQVYDDTAHVLPVLFSFTTPAKFCFRAIASFTKRVTGMYAPPADRVNTSRSMPDLPIESHNERPKLAGQPTHHSEPCITKTTSETVAPQSDKYRSARKTHSIRLSSILRSSIPCSRSTLSVRDAKSEDHVPSNDLTKLDLQAEPNGTIKSEERTAGDPSVYKGLKGPNICDGPMIRERVGTNGITRPLEPENEMEALQVPLEKIGRLSELAIRRYLTAKAKFDRKFEGVIISIEKQRWKRYKRTHRQRAIFQRSEIPSSSSFHDTESRALFKIFDGENPPPTSIVSMADETEARKLAKIADQSIMTSDQTLSGNHFWSTLVNFFTIVPGKEKPNTERETSKMLQKFSLDTRPIAKAGQPS